MADDDARLEKAYGSRLSAKSKISPRGGVYLLNPL